MPTYNSLGEYGLLPELRGTPSGAALAKQLAFDPFQARPLGTEAYSRQMSEPAPQAAPRGSGLGDVSSYGSGEMSAMEEVLSRVGGMDNYNQWYASLGEQKPRNWEQALGLMGSPEDEMDAVGGQSIDGMSWPSDERSMSSQMSDAQVESIMGGGEPEFVEDYPLEAGGGGMSIDGMSYPGDTGRMSYAQEPGQASSQMGAAQYESIMNREVSPAMGFGGMSLPGGASGYGTMASFPAEAGPNMTPGPAMASPPPAAQAPGVGGGGMSLPDGSSGYGMAPNASQMRWGGHNLPAMPSMVQPPAQMVPTGEQTRAPSGQRGDAATRTAALEMLKARGLMQGDSARQFQEAARLISRPA